MIYDGIVLWKYAIKVGTEGFEDDLRVVDDNSNTPFVKTYSDKGVMIRKKGTEELYSEAIDPQSLHREYEETDILIDQEIDEVVEDECPA